MASELDTLTMAAAQLEIFSNDEEEDEEPRHIPHDLLTDHILPRLPIKSLIRFKSVSKAWYFFISSSYFAHAHFKLCPFSHRSSPTQCLFVKSGRDYFLLCYEGADDEIVGYFGSKGLVRLNPDFDVDDDELQLVGSCNGVVCLTSPLGYFIIWNPITRQFRRIFDPYPEFTVCSWGFGYASSIDDYKIVRIIEFPKPSNFEMTVHVFSLRTDEWRRIDDKVCWRWFLSRTSVPSISSCLSFLTHRGVQVDETLYWIVYNTQASGRKIISFDLVRESFDEFPDLDLISTGVYYDDDFLCVMGGCLSSCRINMRDDVYITVYKSHEEQESMVLFRGFRLGSCDDSVGFTKSGKFFIIDKYCRKLGLVDRSKWPYKYIPLVRFHTDPDVQIANHVPSLISPLADVELLEG